MRTRNERSAGIWIPKQAALNGFVNNVFFDGFDSLATIDVNNTNVNGFNWYVGNPPQFQVGGPFNPTGSNVAASASWFSVANSVLTISSNATSGQGAEVQSFGYKGSGTYTRTVPLIDASKGYYIEGLMKFALPIGEDFIPDFWMQDLTGMLAQIQSISTPKFGELDVFEGRPSGTGAVQTVDEWLTWNTSQFQRSGATPNSGLDYSVFHRWGAVLIPMAKGGGTGSVTWYIDDVQTGSSVTWTSGGNYATLETAMNEINFAAGNSTPLHIDYIGVWQ